jgi:hypothetical protein
MIQGCSIPTGGSSAGNKTSLSIATRSIQSDYFDNRDSGPSGGRGSSSSPVPRPLCLEPGWVNRIDRHLPDTRETHSHVVGPYCRSRPSRPSRVSSRLPLDTACYGMHIYFSMYRVSQPFGRMLLATAEKGCSEQYIDRGRGVRGVFAKAFQYFARTRQSGLPNHASAPTLGIQGLYDALSACSPVECLDHL